MDNISFEKKQEFARNNDIVIAERHSVDGNRCYYKYYDLLKDEKNIKRTALNNYSTYAYPRGNDDYIEAIGFFKLLFLYKKFNDTAKKFFENWVCFIFGVDPPKLIQHEQKVKRMEKKTTLLQRSVDYFKRKNNKKITHHSYSKENKSNWERTCLRKRDLLMDLIKQEFDDINTPAKFYKNFFLEFVKCREISKATEKYAIEKFKKKFQEELIQHYNSVATKEFSFTVTSRLDLSGRKIDLLKEMTDNLAFEVSKKLGLKAKIRTFYCSKENKRYITTKLLTSNINIGQDAVNCLFLKKIKINSSSKKITYEKRNIAWLKPEDGVKLILENFPNEKLNINSEKSSYISASYFNANSMVNYGQWVADHGSSLESDGFNLFKTDELFCQLVYDAFRTLVLLII